MIVRALGPQDARAWRAMMREAVRADPDAFLLSPREVLAITEARAAETVARGTLHGLLESDRLRGFAGLQLRQLDRLRHRAEIGPFYVAPDVRGTGAADRLMDALAERARAAGADWLDLWAAIGNGRARAFYARHGFRDVAVREDAVRQDGVPADDVLMARRL